MGRCTHLEGPTPLSPRATQSPWTKGMTPRKRRGGPCPATALHAPAPLSHHGGGAWRCESPPGCVTRSGSVQHDKHRAYGGMCVRMHCFDKLSPPTTHLPTSLAPHHEIVRLDPPVHPHAVSHDVELCIQGDRGEGMERVDWWDWVQAVWLLPRTLFGCVTRILSRTTRQVAWLRELAAQELAV